MYTFDFYPQETSLIAHSAMSLLQALPGESAAIGAEDPVSE